MSQDPIKITGICEREFENLGDESWQLSFRLTSFPRPEWLEEFRSRAGSKAPFEIRGNTLYVEVQEMANLDFLMKKAQEAMDFANAKMRQLDLANEKKGNRAAQLAETIEKKLGFQRLPEGTEPGDQTILDATLNGKTLRGGLHAIELLLSQLVEDRIRSIRGAAKERFAIPVIAELAKEQSSTSPEVIAAAYQTLDRILAKANKNADVYGLDIAVGEAIEFIASGSGAIKGAHISIALRSELDGARMLTKLAGRIISEEGAEIPFEWRIFFKRDERGMATADGPVSPLPLPAQVTVARNVEIVFPNGGVELEWPSGDYTFELCAYVDEKAKADFTLKRSFWLDEKVVKSELLKAEQAKKPREIKTTLRDVLSPIKLGEVRFDFLPASPLFNGWKESYSTVGAFPTFTHPKEASYSGGLAMHVHGKFAMEHLVDGASILANRVRFAARFTGLDNEIKSMIFVLVMLRSKDGTKWKEAQLAIKLGRAKPEKYEDGWLEWQISVSGEPLPEEGWRLFEIAIPFEIKRTFGNEGWQYESLRGIRLRGRLSISAIELFEDA